MSTKNARHGLVGAVCGTAAILAVAGVATVSSVASAQTASSSSHSSAQTVHSIRLPEGATSPLVLGGSAAGGVLVGVGALATRAATARRRPRSPLDRS